MTDTQDALTAHEYANIFPMLTDDRLNELAADIKENGLREAVMMYGDKILDGRNRFAACRIANIPCRYDQFEGDDEAALAFVMSKNLKRRHLTTNEAAMIGAKYATAVEGRPKTRSNDQVTGATNTEAAAMVEVSEPTIRRAKKVLKDGVPALQEMVNANKINVATAAVIARLPEDEQDDLCARGSDALKQRAKAGECHVHVGANSGNNEWYTPTRFLEAARDVMGSIDTDPASCEVANRNVQAATFYTAEDDGLTKTWTGNVWMNPPYAQPLIEDFCLKLVDEYKTGNVKSAIVLVNNGTETKWGQALIREARALCYPASRIKFLDKDGKPTGAPLQGQMIAYFGPEVSTFKDTFSLFGGITLAAA